jgi:hypothetical protein
LQGGGFNAIGEGWLFEEDVLSCAKGLDGPFVVEAIGERNVDCVDGGIV